MEIEVQAGIDSVRLSGKYWFGDPCYILDNKNDEHDAIWDKFCFRAGGAEYGTSTWGDHTILFSGTAQGDGSFDVIGFGMQKKIGVDAGMLALVPVALIDELDTLLEVGDSGMFVSINDDVVSVDGSGNWDQGIFCKTLEEEEE